MQQKIRFTATNGLTWRAVLLTILGSILITISSMYIALKMSALPWPTIFVAILSMSLLKLGGKISRQTTDLNEINITQTGIDVYKRQAQ